MAGITYAKVHVSTLLSIIEQYQRRSDNYPVRLIGAILGSVVPATEQEGGDGLAGNHYFAEIRHSFPVPHSEVGDQISINSEYYKTRMELHRKGSSRDSVLLGWYSAVLTKDASKPVDATIFAKNGGFIRDYFIREANTKGAPFALNLCISIDAAGQISLETFKYPTNFSREAPGAAHPSEPQVLPVKVTYGVPEAFAVDICCQSLLAEEVARSRDGKVLARLPNWQGYRQQSRELANSQAALLMEHQKEASDDQTARQILSKLGLTNSTSESKQSLARNQEDFCEAVDELNKQLSKSDRLLLTQSFLMSS